jgi:anthranilate phosphoribosyltransferase
MGPKYGVTHRQVLRAAGLPVDLGPEEVAARVGDPDIGWGYVDQKHFAPKLHALAALRTLILKRPAITTAEVLTGPLRGRVKTHLVTGYVHKPYPRIYALLARHAGFDSALIVRGVEGSVIPLLSQAGKVFHYHDGGEEVATELTPADVGIDQAMRAPRIPGRDARREEGGDEQGSATLDTAQVAKLAADAGMAALAGQPGATRDSLIYGGALCLWHRGRYESLAGAAQAVRTALDSGKALAHLRRTL